MISPNQPNHKKLINNDVDKDKAKSKNKAEKHIKKSEKRESFRIFGTKLFQNNESHPKFGYEFDMKP